MKDFFTSALISKFVSDVVDKIKKWCPKHPFFILSICIAVLVSLSAFWGVFKVANFLGYPRVVINEDLKVNRDVTSISIKDALITADIISQMNKLHELSSVHFTDCDFEDGVLSSLCLPLIVFGMNGCTGVTNYSFLSHFPDLHTLSLIDCGVTDSGFKNFSCSKIEQISLNNNKLLTDLSFLPMERLVYLNISDTGVENLDSLGFGKNLNYLTGNNTCISDLSPLAGLTELRHISFNNCQIREITSEFMSLRITRISLYNNEIADCSGFTNLTILEEVDLSDNKLSDVSWLTKSSKTMKDLRLSGNPLSMLDLAFLWQCNSMERLYLDEIEMRSLDFIEGMSELQVLSANRCGIEDITCVGVAPHLEYAYLAFNEISDITPLQGNYAVLDLGFNKISIIDGLDVTTSGMLVLAGNPLVLACHTFDAVHSKSLYFDYSDGLVDIEPKGWFLTSVYIIACPPDRQLKAADIFGRNVFFPSQEDISASLWNRMNKYNTWPEQLIFDWT